MLVRHIVVHMTTRIVIPMLIHIAEAHLPTVKLTVMDCGSSAEQSHLALQDGALVQRIVKIAVAHRFASE